MSMSVKPLIPDSRNQDYKNKQTPSPIFSKLKKWRLNQMSGKKIENKSAKSSLGKLTAPLLIPAWEELWHVPWRSSDLKSSHAEGQSQGRLLVFFHRFFLRFNRWGQVVFSKKWVVHQYDIQWQQSKHHICTYSTIHISIEIMHIPILPMVHACKKKNSSYLISN